MSGVYCVPRHSPLRSHRLFVPNINQAKGVLGSYLELFLQWDNPSERVCYV